MIRGQSVFIQSLLGSLFTWGMTALGAAGVFLFRHDNRRLLDGSLGFAGGVMTAASFWSLLAPALDIAESEWGESLAFVPVAIGVLVGAVFVYGADVMLPDLGSGGGDPIMKVVFGEARNGDNKNNVHVTNRNMYYNQQQPYAHTIEYSNSSGEENRYNGNNNSIYNENNGYNDVNNGNSNKYPTFTYSSNDYLSQGESSMNSQLTRRVPTDRNLAETYENKSSQPGAVGDIGRSPSTEISLDRPPLTQYFGDKLPRGNKNINFAGSSIDYSYNSGHSLPTRQLSVPASSLSWKRILLLIIAIVVHNIPEGLVVGVGFGAVGKTPKATFEKARHLALGIGIQNFPEGLAVSLPLSGMGTTKWRAFLWGQLSGIVEPVAAILGGLAVSLMEPLLPYALSFAAGAMLFVVVDDIIPETQLGGHGKLASWTFTIGFLVMMGLDVGLG